MLLGGILGWREKGREGGRKKEEKKKERGGKQKQQQQQVSERASGISKVNMLAQMRWTASESI